MAETTVEPARWNGGTGADWQGREENESVPLSARPLRHGDAYIGNLLREPGGRFVLCDFDGASVGPLANDVVVAAVSALRLGVTQDHEAVVATYGVDVTTLSSWPVLRRIRELVLVTSVITDLRNRPEIARIHAHRLSLEIRRQRTLAAL